MEKFHLDSYQEQLVQSGFILKVQQKFLALSEKQLQNTLHPPFFKELKELLFQIFIQSLQENPLLAISPLELPLPLLLKNILGISLEFHILSPDYRDPYVGVAQLLYFYMQHHSRPLSNWGEAEKTQLFQETAFRLLQLECFALLLLNHYKKHSSFQDLQKITEHLLYQTGSQGAESAIHFLKEGNLYALFEKISHYEQTRKALLESQKQACSPSLIFYHEQQHIQIQELLNFLQNLGYFYSPTTRPLYSYQNLPRPEYFFSPSLPLEKQIPPLEKQTSRLEKQIPPLEKQTTRLEKRPVQKLTKNFSSGGNRPKTVTSHLSGNLSIFHRKIMLVDPQISVLQTLENQLLNQGFPVISFTEGKKAWEYLQNQEADLLISECLLDEIDGFTLLNLTRRLANPPLFVFYTAIEDAMWFKQAYDHGAEDYLLKSLPMEAFLSKIIALLRKPKERKGESVSGLSGNLQEIELADILQMLGRSQKTVCLHLANEQEEGKIYFEEGKLVHAFTPHFLGMEALFHLFQWKQGRFHSTSSENSLCEKNLDSLPLDHILLEVFRLLDEKSL
jgi:CheY-like chemotaxis protein